MMEKEWIKYSLFKSEKRISIVEIVQILIYQNS